ncbi:hypothetical protein K9M74_00415 [Candidatus Woesearchaeota archaeon]|nr:hypothetical protein [Candidatus Woesearchaeota archaeon]
MGRGRPSKSIVRDRLVEIIFVAGKMTAYDAYKHYIRLFGKASQRNIYYQLQRGEAMGIFSREVKDEQGDYTWGNTAQKVYYSLTDQAQPRINKEVRSYFLEVNKKSENN